MKDSSIKKLSSSELSYFCSQIAMILKSGMLIFDGIDWMYNDIEEGNIKNALKSLKNELTNKVALYEAMENSGYFPSYIINMSKIGNLTGRLDDVMSSLAEYYERENILKAKIRNAIFYPSMLFVMMSIVILIIVTKIFPIFEGMINELGGKLSLASTIASKLSLVIVIALLVGLIFIYLLGKSKKGKIALDRFLKNNLFTKAITKKILAYRFALSMSLLLSSGINIDKSLNLLLDMIDEEELKTLITKAKNSINEGEDFIEAIARLSLFSSMHVQMLSMGQKTGELDVVMKKITDIYEFEAEQKINNAVSLIEPVIVGVLCVLIGFIIISVMLPLMNIMSSIG